MASPPSCSRPRRHARIHIIILALWCSRTHGWSDLRAAWGVSCRGGSTDEASSASLDESMFLDEFQEEVLQMRREIEQESSALLQNLRQEIMAAKESGALQRREEEHKVSEAIELEDDYDEESQEVEAAVESKVVDLEPQEPFELEDEERVPLVGDEEEEEEREKIQVFEDTDDFLVGDSDEEPESVMGKLKTPRAKVEDVLDVPVEEEEAEVIGELESRDEEEVISHLAEADATSEAKVTPKKKGKKGKKKKPKKKVQSDKVVPKKKKPKPKKKKTTPAKEAVQTVLTSKTKGDQVLVWKTSPLVETLVKGAVLGVLLVLAVLVLRVLEKSVTNATPVNPIAGAAPAP